VLEPEDDVVGVAHDDHVALGLQAPPSLSPEIEDIVQVDVGQQRRDYRTLTSSYVTCVDDPIVQDACLQPFSDEANDTSVADPVLQETDEPLVINRVKEAPNVGIQDVVHFLSRDSND